MSKYNTYELKMGVFPNTIQTKDEYQKAIDNFNTFEKIEKYLTETLNNSLYLKDGDYFKHMTVFCDHCIRAHPHTVNSQEINNLLDEIYIYLYPWTKYIDGE